jgi:hypothetical protein
MAPVLSQPSSFGISARTRGLHSDGTETVKSGWRGCPAPECAHGDPPPGQRFDTRCGASSAGFEAIDRPSPGTAGIKRLHTPS